MTRIGASQVFFNIVAQFNAEKLIKDYRSVNTVMKAVSLDTFEAILKPIEGLGQAINTITDELNPLQEALGLAAVEFEKFFGEIPQMEAMRDEVIKLGEAFNITAVEALAAGSRAAQVANIIGRSNVKTLMELAFTLSEISDLNAEEAQRGIIQLHQQTGMLFGELNAQSFTRLTLQEQQNVLVHEGAKALDALNTIANRSVALEGDLVRVMGTFAAQGELVGDSFSFMAAASAVLLEAGEEQGTAGRALRMMYARLGGDISGARTQVEEMLKVSLMQNGEMKSMENVLGTLAPKWRGMSGAQKQNVAQTIAGNRHYVRFIKLMENYDRTMQLTTDGIEGFDSATEQATTALGRQVNKLRKTQNEVETLKAMIGEGLTPFMQGQVDVQKDYLTVTHALTDGLGPLGEVMGRLKGTMEVMGSFIKVGLATQSLGIGFEMFTSVQRQLNGILVANEHLHSKSANWLEHGVKATATQRDLLQGMQYIEQKINANASERRWIQKGMLADEHLLAEAKRKLLVLDETRLPLMDKMVAVHFKLLGAQKMETANLQNQDSLYEKRIARIQYEGTIESQMLDRVNQLYNTKSATQDAMMRQYLADMQTAASLSDDEIAHIDMRHNRLKEEHTLLQQIKSDNDIRFRTKGGGRDRAPMEYNVFGGKAGKMQMSDQDRQIIASRMEVYAGEHHSQFERMMKKEGVKFGQDKRGGNQYLTAVNKLSKKNVDAGAAAKQIMIDRNQALSLSAKVLTGEIELEGQEFFVLEQLMQKVEGQIVQTTRTQETLAMMTVEQREQLDLLTTTQMEHTAVTALLNAENAEATSLVWDDITANERLEPLMKQILALDKEDIMYTENLLGLKNALGTSVDKLTKTQAGFIQSEKDVVTATQDRTMATRQFGFAMNNTLGLLSGMVGGTMGASLSLGFMTSNLVTSSIAAGKAGKSMVAMMVKQTLAIQTSDKHTKKLWLEKFGLDATTAARVTAIATMGLMVAAYAGLGLAIYAFQKEAEKTAEKMRKMNEEMMVFESIVDTLAGDKKILEDDVLAKTLGIDNLSTSEIRGNGELIEDTIGKLTRGLGDFTKVQNTQIENALKYLKVLVATDDYTANLYDADKFAEQARDVRKEINLMTILGEGTVGFMMSDIDKGKELFEDINRKGMDFNELGYSSTGSLKRNLNDIIGYMEEGNKLTQTQLELAEDYFNDDEISTYLREMNRLVITDKARQYGLNAIAKATGEVAGYTDSETEALKNLTEEIYNFSGAREELFFGGQYGNVTGSLYKQVVKQGVGTLYHKNEVIMTTNFHGFFNEKEAAEKITRIVTEVLAK